MRLLIPSALLLLTVAGAAQEKVTLATPETTANNLAYRIDRITLISDDPDTPAADGFIHIELRGIERPGLNVTCSYGPTTTPTGTTLVNGLNKANLSSAYNNNATTGSLKQRIFHRLVVMGEAATVCSKSVTGTLSGSPE